MTPLKVEFKRDGAKVAVKVLSQDESTRGEEEIFRSSEGFRLVSIALPAVHSKFANTLYVRGSCKEQDYLWSSTAVADSPRAAAEYIEKAERAIHEYNESIKEKETMCKFIFKVWRDDYTVTMRIFEQPEKTRGKGKLFEHNDVEIWSDDQPELAIDGTIYICGICRSCDSVAAKVSFRSLDEAEAYRKKITEALNAYAKHLEEQETPKRADKLVYQFDRIGCVIVATPIHIPEWVEKKFLFSASDGFALLRSTVTEVCPNSLYLPSIADKGKCLPCAGCFFSTEVSASKWIRNAARAIAECNAKYATVVEPKAMLISRETIIAE